MEEENDDFFKEYQEWMKNENEKMNQAFEFYKKNCIIPFSQIKDLDVLDFSDVDFYHNGYCTVEKRDVKNPWRKSAEYFEVKQVEGDIEDRFKLLTFEKQEYTRKFHVLVYQTLGCCEDDYSGYIIFPMKDGRYWIVRFCNI